jgi:steroid delta-isomerase-like uncharacterized protein
MPAEQNKALVRRIFTEVLNNNKRATAGEILSPGYVNHDMPSPGPGPEGFLAIVDGFRSAFPDLHMVTEALVAEGETVATRGTFTGTHKGDFMGIPATGKKVAVPYIDLWRFEDGKAVENWVRLDSLSLMQQLGVVPKP